MFVGDAHTKTLFEIRKGEKKFKYDNYFVVLTIFWYIYFMTIPLNRELCVLFLALAGTLEDSQKKAAKRFGLNRTEGKILSLLQEKGARTVPQMARFLGVTRQNVQVAVNALLGKNLLLAAKNPDHKTSALFALTERGQMTARAMGDWQQERLDEILSPLSLGEKTEVKRVVQKLI